MKHFCIIYRNVNDGSRRMTGVTADSPDAAKSIAAERRRSDEIIETVY